MASDNTIWLPTPDSSGECYHAKVCNKHCLEPYPREVAEAIIRRENLTPCIHCLEHHDLQEIEQSDYKVMIQAKRTYTVKSDSMINAKRQVLSTLDSVFDDEWDSSVTSVWREK